MERAIPHRGIFKNRDTNLQTRRHVKRSIRTTRILCALPRRRRLFNRAEKLIQLVTRALSHVNSIAFRENRRILSNSPDRAREDFVYLKIPIESADVYAARVPPMVFQGCVVYNIDHRTNYRRRIASDPVEERLQPALRALAMAVQIREHRSLGRRCAQQARPDKALPLIRPDNPHLRIIHHVVFQLTLQMSCGTIDFHRYWSLGANTELYYVAKYCDTINVSVYNSA